MEARRQSPAPHGDQLYVEIFKSGMEGLPWWLSGLDSAPLQETQMGSNPGQGTKIPHVCQKIKLN